MDGSTSAIPRPPALNAPQTFAKAETAPFGGIHATGNQNFIRIGDGADAVFADRTDEALRQNTVERGDEVVGLDAHIEEATQHVDHVVGVDRGEDEVAGECGVDSNLGGFLVADFADEDLVGVVPQDGSEASGEGQALLFVYRNLGNAADLVFDRVFNCDDLVFVAFDFVEGGVERGGFAGTG